MFSIKGCNSCTILQILMHIEPFNHALSFQVKLNELGEYGRVHRGYLAWRSTLWNTKTYIYEKFLDAKRAPRGGARARIPVIQKSELSKTFWDSQDVHWVLSRGTRLAPKISQHMHVQICYVSWSTHAS